MTYDYLACVGRFQPLHLGHCHVIQAMLSKARHAIVLVGSPNVSRSVKNPFTYEERAEMFGAVFGEEMAAGRLLVRPVDDHDYNEMAWAAAMQHAMDAALCDAGVGGATPLGSIASARKGFVSCRTGAYNRFDTIFPHWNIVEIEIANATDDMQSICRKLFRATPALPHDACPPRVVSQLERFSRTVEFASLVEEADYLEDFKESWATAPYPPTFVTVDCVVVQSGHVLLVRRGERPGRGLLALPGGFIDVSDALQVSAVRELMEETNIADRSGPIGPEVLASFIDHSKTRVFDAPDRSARGRTITHAYLFRCPDGGPQFEVKGGDDAESANWHRLGDLDPRTFFEDHWFILQAMTGL